MLIKMQILGSLLDFMVIKKGQILTFIGPMHLCFQCSPSSIKLLNIFYNHILILKYIRTFSWILKLLWTLGTVATVANGEVGSVTRFGKGPGIFILVPFPW